MNCSLTRITSYRFPRLRLGSHNTNRATNQWSWSPTHGAARSSTVSGLYTSSSVTSLPPRPQMRQERRALSGVHGARISVATTPIERRDERVGAVDPRWRRATGQTSLSSGRTNTEAHEATFLPCEPTVADATLKATRSFPMPTGDVGVFRHVLLETGFSGRGRELRRRHRLLR